MDRYDNRQIIYSFTPSYPIAYRYARASRESRIGEGYSWFARWLWEVLMKMKFCDYYGIVYSPTVRKIIISMLDDYIFFIMNLLLDNKSSNPMNLHSKSTKWRDKSISMTQNPLDRSKQTITNNSSNIIAELSATIRRIVMVGISTTTRMILRICCESYFEFHWSQVDTLGIFFISW